MLDQWFKFRGEATEEKEEEEKEEEERGSERRKTKNTQRCGEKEFVSRQTIQTNVLFLHNFLAPKCSIGSTTQALSPNPPKYHHQRINVMRA